MFSGSGEGKNYEADATAGQQPDRDNIRLATRTDDRRVAPARRRVLTKRVEQVRRGTRRSRCRRLRRIRLGGLRDRAAVAQVARQNQEAFDEAGDQGRDDDERNGDA